jgi:hypothetical protein
MYRKPIFIAGKEVPHSKPANPVKSSALFLLFSKTRKNHSFISDS